MQLLIDAIRRDDEVAAFLAGPCDFDLDWSGHTEPVHLASGLKLEGCQRSRYSPGLTSGYSPGSGLWLMFYRECSVSVESDMGTAVPDGLGFLLGR